MLTYDTSRPTEHLKWMGIAAPAGIIVGWLFSLFAPRPSFGRAR